ncbi:MAG: Agmatinase [Verrucomicrobiaceae bacterium]|nr:Agmatinase [Verrucomicrobiaceae bacterium]
MDGLQSFSDIMKDHTPSTFIGLPSTDIDHLEGVRVAVMAACEASPSSPMVASHSANAPAAIRKASATFAGRLAHFDFDLGVTMFPNEGDFRGMVDLGDIKTNVADAPGNRKQIENTVRRVLSAGAVPIVLGGDDSVPIPVLAAYEDHGPIHILQIDAHVDWADVVGGNAYGYGSPMRRASEYPWVKGMLQVGMRGLGSGVVAQHEDAKKWGSKLVTSYELHKLGVEQVCQSIPMGARCFISLDCDGIDPSVFPAVNGPAPGGLSYEDVIELIKGVADRASIAGMALVEFVPESDGPRSYRP